DGKGGFDWASYADATAGISANLTAGTVVTGGVTDTLISIEGIIGSAYNDTFTGTAGADAFRGNGGIDRAFGGAGNDTYVVDPGGRTFVTDVFYSELNVINGKYVNSYEGTLGDAGQDAIEFGAGIALADIIVAKTETMLFIEGTGEPFAANTGGFDLNVTILDDSLAASTANLITGDGVTIGGWFSYAQLMYTITNPTSGHTRTETFRFADGLEISVGGISVVASDLNDVSSTWTGTSANEWYSGRGGDDIINGGGGNDILIGGSGNDTIYGGNGNDVLAGGSGNDLLRGQAGYDIYSFGRGDDHDTIQQNGADASGGLLIFGEDIRYDQLWFSQSGQNLVVSVLGTADRVTISGFFSTATREVTEFRAGGLSLDTAATSAAVQQLVSAMAAFSPPPPGQLELSSEIRNDTNVSAALAAWAA
ncbi:MAG: calcium-binding protein, partial [Alphaproteobacteria bacterium]|nr:calcium-binding protein [Alphaproteobacteria bacterium]